MNEEELIAELHRDAVDLLRSLIRTPSLSGEENRTADLIAEFLTGHGADVRRLGNNIWCRSRRFESNRPTILLNSHHDTVPASAGYTRDPHDPAIEEGRLYGLGSNDAGGPLVSLIATFLFFEKVEGLDANLILAATAEEENSGPNGVSMLLPELGPIDFGIVGEPTSLRMAIAERGLMVLNCTAHGRSGHAARNEGENAIYNALRDIEWFRTYNFQPESQTLGPVKMTVTVIEAGTKHNVVPDTCRFTVDVRTTDTWRNEEVLDVIRENVGCDVRPRSVRSNASGIDGDHPLVKAAGAIGLETYGSPTISDQAFMSFPTVKFGPGDSARSHTPDEWVGIDSIERGISISVALIREAIRTGAE